MTFTYVLRYSGGVGLEMQYTLLDGTVKNGALCERTEQNGGDGLQR